MYENSNSIVNSKSKVKAANNANQLNFCVYFIIMLDGEEQEALGRGWSLPWISSAPPSDHITAMAATNCGTRIAAIHESGAVSVWALPSLLLESRVLLSEQPNFDEINPQLLQVKKIHGMKI